MRADVYELTIAETTYRAEGVDDREGQVKATVAAYQAGVDQPPSHSDRVNLDILKQRQKFADAIGVDAGDLWTLRESIIAARVPTEDAGAEPETAPDDDALAAGLALLGAPDILKRAGETIRRLGYAGSLIQPMLLFLVFVSRLLERPINVVVTGPSSAGKSFMVTTVCRLLPTSAVYALVGMSARMLAYTNADLQHRHLIVNEAAALAQEGIGAVLLRALAWEGQIRYETIESTSEGIQPRVIERPGPTGFITTTTGAVEPELETRVLTINVSDSAELTETILLSAANRAMGQQGEEPDLKPWRAAQWWLEHEGARNVIIPYADQLAAAYPKTLVRGRRDFQQVLNLIQASAILHQRQRERDAGGRIIATVDDYRHVHELTVELFGAIAAEGVTEAVRRVVEMVGQLSKSADAQITVSAVAKALGSDRSSVHRLVERAVERGWLVNNEERERRPAKPKVGEKLPDVQSALPHPDTITPPPPDSTLTHYPDFPDVDAEKQCEAPLHTDNTPAHYAHTGLHTDFPDTDAENEDSVQVCTENSVQNIDQLRAWLANGTLTVFDGPIDLGANWRADVATVTGAVLRQLDEGKIPESLAENRARQIVYAVEQLLAQNAEEAA